MESPLGNERPESRSDQFSEADTGIPDRAGQLRDLARDTTRPPGTDYAFYHQVPLGSGRNSIRLLSLLPGRRGMPISCTLEVCSLSDNPKYEALSYAWGAHKSLEEIRVNESSLWVQRNLESALQNLRHVDKPRRLWIDRICINQDSSRERAAQVSIMKQIYASAHTTIAWLGDDIEGSKTIQSFFSNDCALEEIEDAVRHNADQHATSGSKSGRWLRRGVSAAKSLRQHWNEFFPLHIKQLRFTLQAPYFARAWILQEIAVSRNVILQCGLVTVQMQRFVQSFKTCMSKADVIDHVDKKKYDSSWYERGQVLELLHHLDFESSSLSLRSSLSLCRSFQAGREADKVFALYGLAASDVETLGLYPDYITRVEDVYTEIAYATMKTLGDMAVLEMPRGNSKLRQNLPSWVPDWFDSTRLGTGLTPEFQALRTSLHSATPRRHWSNDHFDKSKTTLRSVATQRFYASKSADKGSVYRTQNNVLHISAMTVDSIAEQSKVFSELYTEPTEPLYSEGFRKNLLYMFEGLQAGIESWREVIAWRKRFSSNSPYLAGGSTQEALFRTLCTDTVPSYIRCELVETLASWFDRFSDDFEKSGLRYMAGRNVMIGRTEEIRHASGVTWQYYAAVEGRKRRDSLRMLNVIGPITGRRMALTSKGYLCLVPAGSNVGDTLIIPQGGSLPLVVRPNGETHTLVGESYVHGIMNGEAWSQDLCQDFAIS